MRNLSRLLLQNTHFSLPRNFSQIDEHAGSAAFLVLSGQGSRRLWAFASQSVIYPSAEREENYSAHTGGLLSCVRVELRDPSQGPTAPGIAQVTIHHAKQRRVRPREQEHRVAIVDQTPGTSTR